MPVLLSASPAQRDQLEFTAAAGTKSSRNGKGGVRREELVRDVRREGQLCVVCLQNTYMTSKACIEKS